jgi:prepilin-type N-terminal cleavage/methylation domain-containing protein
MKKMKKQEAFTLIELLVVIAIIAILAISVAVGYQSVRKSANNAKRIETVRNIATAEELYNNINGSYTDDISELVSGGFLGTNPADREPCPDSCNKNIDWDNTGGYDTIVTGNGGKSFYVRARIKCDGDEKLLFCCSENGCKKTDDWLGCQDW